MCLSFDQVQTVLGFFVGIKDKQKGISNLVDKIEYYDESNSILTEKENDIDIDLYLTQG